MALCSKLTSGNPHQSVIATLATILSPSWRVTLWNDTNQSNERLRERVKILLVDDDPWARKLHALLLRDLGHEVVPAGDGAEAWQLLSENEISLIVSDWLMPKVSGTELCRKIRSAIFPRYIYVILLTAKGDKKDLIEGMDAGADDFLVKPINREELRVRIRAAERILQLERGLEQRNQELAGTNEVITKANQQLQQAYQLIEKDLRAAAWMQENLLPPTTLRACGIDCRWYFRPTRYVAGDILNFFELDSGIVGFYMLDVSGHGVPSAMLSVSLSMVLTPASSHGSPLKEFNADTGKFEVAEPAEAIHELNRRFQAKDDHYFTIVYGIINTHSRKLKLVLAGHPSPILFRQKAAPAYLDGTGMPIGLMPEIEFDCIETDFGPGDRLILYSDGVTECVDATGEAFGAERLLDAMTERRDWPLDGLLQGLEATLDGWKCGEEFSDDISAMAIEFAADISSEVGKGGKCDAAQ